MKKQEQQFLTLIPIFAIGILVILSISVYASYRNTASMKPTVILPGGVTYLGK